MKRLFIVVIVLALASAAFAATTKRLILKDGSYQVVAKYEVKGDRVRYLSAERYEWEEIPKSLVDWAATEKWEKDQAAGAATAQRQLSAEEQKEMAEMEAETPQVAPGIRLPITGGVFLLDAYQGQAQLAELVQQGSEINKQTGKNILRSVVNPIAISSTQTVELKGAHAKVQSHVGDPFIFVNVEPEDPKDKVTAQNAADRFRIVRSEVKGDKRIVGQLKVMIYGKVKQQEKFIPVNAEAVSGGPWIKLTPAQKLEPGEYAVVELLGKDVNLFVWDFGVNPAAPANPTAWKPQPTQKTASQPPVLKKPTP